MMRPFRTAGGKNNHIGPYSIVGCVALLSLGFSTYAQTTDRRTDEPQTINQSNIEAVSLRAKRGAIGYTPTDIDALIQQESINRSQLLHLVGGLRCVDCRFPRQSTQAAINALTNPYVDIAPPDDRYACVASFLVAGMQLPYETADSTSSDQFVPNEDVLVGEWLFLLYDIIRYEMTNRFSVRRATIIDQGNIPAAHRATIRAAYDACPVTNCSLTSVAQFDAMVAYCRANPSSCPIPGFRRSYATDTNAFIVFLADSLGLVKRDDGLDDPFALLSGAVFVEMAGAMANTIRCTASEIDYDSDGIFPFLDNCPTTYNPRQRDTNNDGVGDVCTNDISGDGNTHPVGIVDDDGYIVPDNILDGGVDNPCLFQTDQSCLDENNAQRPTQSGLTFSLLPDDSYAPVTATIAAIPSDTRIQRGNNTSSSGPSQTTYTAPGTYNIRLSQKNKTASGVVMVQTPPDEQYAGSLRCSPSLFSGLGTTNCTFDLSGDIEQIFWRMPGAGYYGSTSESHEIRSYGSHRICALGYDSEQVVQVRACTIVGARRPDYAGLDYIPYTITMALPRIFVDTDETALVRMVFDHLDPRRTSGYRRSFLGNRTGLTASYKKNVSGSYQIEHLLYVADDENTAGSTPGGGVRRISRGVLGIGRLGQTMMLEPTTMRPHINETVGFRIVRAGERRAPVLRVDWDFGDGTTQTTSSILYNHTYTSPGIYEVSAVVTTTDEVFDLQITVGVVQHDARRLVGNRVHVNNLTPLVGERVRISVDAVGIDINDINTIERDFGDEYIVRVGGRERTFPNDPERRHKYGSSPSVLGANARHYIYEYDSPGSYTITHTITLNDGSIYSADTIVSVGESNTLGSDRAPGLALKTASLNLSVGTSNRFQAKRAFIRDDQIAEIQFDPGSDNAVVRQTFEDGLFFVEYQRPGEFRPFIYIRMQDGTELITTLQVAVTANTPLDAIGVRMELDSLTPRAQVPLGARLVTDGLPDSFFDYVIRDLDQADQVFTRPSKEIEITFDEPGPQTIYGTLYDVNGFAYTTQVSLYVLPPYDPTGQLQLIPTMRMSDEPMTATLAIDETMRENISYVVWSHDYAPPIRTSDSSHTFTYEQPGTSTITARAHMQDGSVYSYSATAGTTLYDPCFSSLIDGSPCTATEDEYTRNLMTTPTRTYESAPTLIANIRQHNYTVDSLCYDTSCGNIVLDAFIRVGEYVRFVVSSGDSANIPYMLSTPFRFGQK